MFLKFKFRIAHTHTQFSNMEFQHAIVLFCNYWRYSTHMAFMLWWVCVLEADTLWGHLYMHGITVISAWISNNIHCKVWSEIKYTFPNFNGAIVKFCELIRNFISIYRTCHYLSTLGMKLIHVCKRGPGHYICFGFAYREWFAEHI